MIDVRSIYRSYGREVVLSDVSLRLEKGRVTSFIGPNGAGKTTLLNIISRLTKPDAGSVSIDGRDLAEWKPNELAKKLSILKQSNNLNVRITARELVAFGRFPHSGGRLNDEDEEMIDRSIAYMELGEMQNKYLDELSGGQRQRAFIAMVVAQDTEHILLDEPLNNLDMRHSREMMQVLRRLADELGKTIVTVLHDINFASCYSDAIAALKNGKLLHYGNVREIIREDVLKDVFDMDFRIEEHNGRRICIYF